jgi:hypothetical protein
MPFLEELLAYHPGLAFLEATSEFQDKYARTVIARIFYACDPTARQAVDARALRNSNVTAAFNTVDVEEDINQVANYFSYEHFYVLYWRVAAPRARARAAAMGATLRSRRAQCCGAPLSLGLPLTSIADTFR